MMRLGVDCFGIVAWRHWSLRVWTRKLYIYRIYSMSSLGTALDFLLDIEQELFALGASCLRLFGSLGRNRKSSWLEAADLCCFSEPNPVLTFALSDVVGCPRSSLTVSSRRKGWSSSSLGSAPMLKRFKQTAFSGLTILTIDLPIIEHRQLCQVWLICQISQIPWGLLTSSSFMRCNGLWT